MSTISNDRLESLQRQFKEEGFNDISVSEIMQLVEENLALRKERDRAEPVAWTDSDELRDAKKSGVGYLFGMGAEANKFADPRRKMMLYTAPAHVDEIAAQAGIDPTIADAYMQGCHDTEARHAETDNTSQQLESLASVKQPSSNLAATIKASRDSDANSSHGSQTTIKQSDGWIPCSERMPEDGVSVLACCKCGDNFSGIYTIRAPVIRSKNSRKDDSMAHHERVTHWQPLPEPPCK